jgi:phosphatidylethanolamine-binding protein (PEBP) family uncharacterized protein
VAVVEFLLTSSAFGKPLARADPGRPGRAWGTVRPLARLGPPSYRFRLHALAEDLRLAPGAGVAELERALTGNLLAVAELVGIYER